MVAVAILLVLVVAFVLLRMWDAAGDAEWPDAAAADAGTHADGPPAPATPGVRVAAIVVALVLGALSYVVVPALVDAVVGGDDGGGTPTVCGRLVPDVTAPAGTASVWLPDRSCE